MDIIFIEYVKHTVCIKYYNTWFDVEKIEWKYLKIFENVWKCLKIFENIQNRWIFENFIWKYSWKYFARGAAYMPENNMK